MPILRRDEKLLVAMLDAFYVDAKKGRSIVAIKPKPPFRPVFQVATTKEGSGVKLVNMAPGEARKPSVFLVEAGESRTPRPEASPQDRLQA